MKILQNAFEARNKKINKIEKIKNIKNPIKDVYEKLKDISLKNFDEIDKEDKDFFLKCFGYFYKQNDFMLRVRIPAGRLDVKQALKIAQVAKKYCKDYIDLTTRMQIELRYIKTKDLFNVVNELDSVGITTFQTGIDNFRNIVTDPLDGVAVDNIIQTYPIIQDLQSIFLKKEEWIGQLPRKFNTGILGSLSNSCNIYGHDISFVLAQKDGVFGFNVYLGGKVGVQAKPANIFITSNEVVLFFKSVIELFKKYGYRDNRNKNRLYFLLQDVGIENFINSVKEYVNYEFSDAGINFVQSKSILADTNKILLKDGSFAKKLIVPAGIFNGTDLELVAKTAQEFGDENLRIGYDQNIYILGIKDIKEIQNSEIIKKYEKFNNIYFRDLIACTGVKTCSFGVIPNKDDAIELANYLKNKIKIDNGLVRMNWSACPKGCGIHGIGDIGFEGCKAKDEEGNRVDGVHIFIGGAITRESREAKLLHKSAPLSEVKYFVVYLLEFYNRLKNKHETFEEFYDRVISKFSIEAIKFYTKINYYFKKNDLSYKFDIEINNIYPNEEYEVFYFGLKLYKMVTKENRFQRLDGLDVCEKAPLRLKENSLGKEYNIPPTLSNIIYLMTHEDKNKRAKVFSEIMIEL